MQERRNSIANTLELCFPCTNPSTWKDSVYGNGPHPLEPQLQMDSILRLPVTSAIATDLTLYHSFSARSAISLKVKNSRPILACNFTADCLLSPFSVMTGRTLLLYGYTKPTGRAYWWLYMVHRWHLGKTELQLGGVSLHHWFWKEGVIISCPPKTFHKMQRWSVFCYEYEY